MNEHSTLNDERQIETDRIIDLQNTTIEFIKNTVAEHGSITQEEIDIVQHESGLSREAVRRVIGMLQEEGNIIYGGATTGYIKKPSREQLIAQLQ